MTKSELIAFKALAGQKGYKYFRLRSGKLFYFAGAFYTESQIRKEFNVRYDFYMNLDSLIIAANESKKFLEDKINALTSINASVKSVEKYVKLLSGLKIELA